MHDMSTITNSASKPITRIFFAGAERPPGATLPTNVSGDCPHHHRTPEAAQRCIDQLDRSIKNGHGPNAYADREVMVQEGRWRNGKWWALSSTTEPWRLVQAGERPRG